MFGATVKVTNVWCCFMALLLRLLMFGAAVKVMDV